MTLLFALLLLTILLAGWALTLLGMPGNWLMVAATAMYAYFVPADSLAAISWQTVIIVLVLAGLGEIIEFLAGAAGTATVGGTKRGAALALVGSVCGGLLGVLIGVPIPLVGPIFAALLFAGLGAMAGAMLGETWAGKNVDTSWRVGKAAFWGRLAGTLGKILVGAVMIAVVLAALVL
jgi:uncharacterized protein